MRDAVFVGIDVSKGTLDVALRPSGESFRVSNDQGGISALVERLSAVQPELVVLEASVTKLQWWRSWPRLRLR